jgi:hypothetical protein
VYVVSDQPGLVLTTVPGAPLRTTIVLPRWMSCAARTEVIA